MLVRVQARQRGKIGRRALQQKQASAVKLQALVKGRQERKEVKALKEEKTNAVVKLQALTKGRNDRKKVQHLKHVKQEQEAQGHAATTLQKVLRGNKERSKVRAIKEEVRGGVGQWGEQWAHWALLGCCWVVVPWLFLMVCCCCLFLPVFVHRTMLPSKCNRCNAVKWRAGNH